MPGGLEDAEYQLGIYFNGVHGLRQDPAGLAWASGSNREK